MVSREPSYMQVAQYVLHSQYSYLSLSKACPELFVKYTRIL